ncbi:MAG: nucleotidyltransferase domain-containing protein [Streptococcus sp.]|nr:nucleotidyltransferase domain-containing protein [Streptococcus sp.]
MNLLDRITTDFVENSHQILGENLVGIYLHGSVAMGCFNDKKSDIDLLVVVNNDITDTIKQ